MNSKVLFIQKQVRAVYASLKPELQEMLAEDDMVSFLANLRKDEFTAAYKHAQTIYKVARKPEDELVTLFHNILFAEDVVTDDSVVFTHKGSPYYASLKEIAKEVGFEVQEHALTGSYWTKDYMISSGKDLVVPLKDSRSNYFDTAFMEKAKANPGLYYSPLNLNDHHQAKANVKSTTEWMKNAHQLLDHAAFARKSVLEGGNFFCAINKLGERFYLIGENVISETMAYTQVDREEAMANIAEELSCSVEQLLPIPQWTYHLDLQMAYLGKGQFIIHSFDQKDIPFELDDDQIVNDIRVTFDFLGELFEKSVIDATCQILEKNHFEVAKVFGCLFYLTDCSDPKQLKYVPYCKNSEGFDGALALMMNGIALDLGDKGRHFLTARSDLPSFKEQFAASLKRLGIKEIHGVDMLEAYDYDGDFSGMAMGIPGASNVTEVAAYMNGALRCQTSIVSRTHSPVFRHPEVSKYRFFKEAEHYDLAINSKPENIDEQPFEAKPYQKL